MTTEFCISVIDDKRGRWEHGKKLFNFLVFVKIVCSPCNLIQPSYSTSGKPTPNLIATKSIIPCNKSKRQTFLHAPKSLRIWAKMKDSRVEEINSIQF